MISPFHCLNSQRPGTSFRVPASRHPFPVKRRRSWTCNMRTRASKVHFGCSYNLNVTASVPPPSPRWRGRSSRENSRSFIWKSKLVASKSGFSFASVRQKAMVDGVPDEESATDLISLAFKICWKGLAALALTLSTVSVAQPEPAYAKFGSSLRGGVHQTVSSSSSSNNSSDSSVEAILAKQLARRFREMSDEELVETLQQLLKASRSSPNSRTAVEEGTVPEDLSTTPKESWKLDAKTAEKIGAEFRGPEKQEPDAGSDKVKDGNQTFGRTPAKRPGGNKISNGELTAPAPAADANNQSRKGTGEKIGEMGKVTEPQGQAISKERPDVEQTNGDARPSGALNSTGEGTAASPVSPTVEADRRPGDSSSGESLSNVPDTGDAAASGSGALKVTPSDGAGGAVGQPENATELLWQEWSRRAAGQTAEGSGGSTSASDATEIWQNVQTNGVLIGTKLFVLTTSFFDDYKEVIGIVLVGSLSFVFVFYLGRSRASSMRSASSGEQSSRLRSQDGFGREGLEPWSSTLSDNSPGRNRRSTIADDGSTASTANWERPSEAIREPANRSVKSTTTPELATSVQRISGLDGVNSREGDRIAAEPPGGGADSFIRTDASSRHQRMIPMTAKEKTDRISDDAARQTQYRRSQDPRKNELIDTTIAGNKGHVYSTGKDRNGRMPRAEDQANQEAKTSDNSVLRTSDGANYVQDRVTVFPIRVDQGVQEPESGTKLGTSDKSRSSTASRYSQNSEDSDRKETASGAFEVKDPSSNRWGRPRERDSERVGSKPNQGHSGRDQDTIPLSLKDMQDSFVHGSVLWIRDNDGVFVPESDPQEENAAKAPHTQPPQGTVKPMSSSANGTLQRRSPKTSRNGSEIAYDYRHLVIDPSSKAKPLEDEQQEPSVATTRQREPVPQGEQMWPLRFGIAGRQAIHK